MTSASSASRKRRSVNPKGLKKKIARTQRLVEKSVNIVHQFARELRPTALDDLGLIATLHSFMKDFMKRTGIRVHFTTFAGVEQLNSARRTVLYRVNKVSGEARLKLFNEAVRLLPPRVPVNIILYPMEGDPAAASAFWRLATFTGGSFLCPSRDWP